MTHVGSTFAETVLFSPVVAGIIHAVDKGHAQDWPKAEPVDLDTACLRNIEAVLSDSEIFSYVHVAEARFEKGDEAHEPATDRSGQEVSEKPRETKTKPAVIQRICADNNLGQVLSVQLTYAFGVGAHKRVRLAGNWLMFGDDGSERVSLTTSREGESEYEILPDSRDPKLQADYIQLATESAMEFLVKLDEKAEISGKDTHVRQIETNTIPSLLTDLDAPEYFVRWRAARTLQKMGHSVRAQIESADLGKVVARLTDLESNDPNDLVRKQAAKALKRFRKTAKERAGGSYVTEGHLEQAGFGSTHVADDRVLLPPVEVVPPANASHQISPSAPLEGNSMPDGVITTGQVWEKLGRNCTVRMTVNSSGAFSDGRVGLTESGELVFGMVSVTMPRNERPQVNPSIHDTFIVFLSSGAIKQLKDAGVDSAQNHFVGDVIDVTGTVEETSGTIGSKQVFMSVDDLNQVKVVKEHDLK